MTGGSFSAWLRDDAIQKPSSVKNFLSVAGEQDQRRMKWRSKHSLCKNSNGSLENLNLCPFCGSWNDFVASHQVWREKKLASAEKNRTDTSARSAAFCTSGNTCLLSSYCNTSWRTCWKWARVTWAPWKKSAGLGNIEIWSIDWTCYKINVD